ncbi:MAG: multidrug ABC transporter substrate-binding protein [Hyphococcus sp.]|nr:MAG: multidrug ABC transporter substrate-binding protein [Marinicaulis sp.]
MSFLDAIIAALKSLRQNMLRSILTTLGIMIGIASVIVMSSINAGAQQKVEEQIASLGSTMLSVSPGASRRGGRSSGANSAPQLSERNLDAIKQAVPNVVDAIGEVRVSTTAVAGGADWPTTITGVHAGFPVVRNWPVATGRFFSEQEVSSGRRYAVVGETIVKEVFEGTNPIGGQLRIGNVPFEVIGVLAAKGQNQFGRDEDDLIVAPASAVRARLAGRDATVPDQLDSIRVLFADNTDLVRAESDLMDIMRTQRRIRPGQADNFRVFNIAEFIRARNETAQTFGVLLAATAAISLLVGGIGIMNIMLVSVTERTREIGLRLAIGARKNDILIQFLVEAVTLCLIGGIIGLGLGLASTTVVAKVAGWDVLINANLVLIAILASAAVGVFFGFFPARRAAKLNPIDALRYE